MIQRVTRARVMVADEEVGHIGKGLVALLGIAAEDAASDADWLLDKTLDLRIFQNSEGKFDRSLREIDGGLLVVSQFTLLADTRRGRRPSFTGAARPEHAKPLYEHFIGRARDGGIATASGRFGAAMQVELVNDGPVTILLNSGER